MADAGATARQPAAIGAVPWAVGDFREEEGRDSRGSTGALRSGVDAVAAGTSVEEGRRSSCEFALAKIFG